MSPDSVSCIVPVHNGERFVAEALDSVLAQTRPPEEILVIDDGSTDATAQVVAGYGAHVSYVVQENHGPAAARNAGMRLATGDLAAFLDADDWWHAEKLERQLAAMAADPSMDLCFTHVQNVFEPEVAADDRSSGGHATTEPGLLSISSLVAWMSLFAEHGGLDETLRQGENMDWFLRLRSCGARVGVVAEPLCFRRYHADNTSRPPDASAENMLNVVRAWRRFNDGDPGAEGVI